VRIVLFCHSLISDWNHGNAHFLRGIASELIARGHAVEVYEPADAWSYRNLVQAHGEQSVSGFQEYYPDLHSNRYEEQTLDLDQVLEDADLVLVHEWNSQRLVSRIGAHRKRCGNYQLFFHDTHHRSVTAPESMAAYDLSGYDGVLAYGEAIRDVYQRRGWGRRIWTWHEAADTRVFRPLARRERSGDAVWIGNWGDDERTAELHEFFLDPVRDLKLKASAYGVRYPEQAVEALRERAIDFGGWLPNYRVPEIFSQFRVTVHVPRRPYALSLPGIPTIRPFEALACGIPLISAPWDDTEGLFTPGKDFLIACNGAAMRNQLNAVMNDPALAAELKLNGLVTILSRHTCAHRVDELLAIYSELMGDAGRVETRAAVTV
jgi:spore maturation protein CgeB